MSGKSSSDDASPTSVVERIFRSYSAAGFLPVLLTVLLVAFALFIPNFLAVQNLLNVLRNSSYLVISAAGQMLVLIVGGFDLSQGAVVALTSVASALSAAPRSSMLRSRDSLVASIARRSACCVDAVIASSVCAPVVSTSPGVRISANSPSIDTMLPWGTF